ncbi:MAG: Valine-tRNA ligase [Candidatus Gottesmanbacteria bacterium GW2011_GWB1_43_11]|uniref:Valine--tRNA ligase n=1 Tax=Candidatus Gottesmanbacteria bacterium GW2011_GWB1_43_11 TaxID=1618446 RepID=A0A0G1FFL4_9BACT|nr:MAG: Valine-tRNA ligase [Candidatus Gottesmanbacteria bacterium GW2011_GWA2_42_16]KKS53002.1 MAG: Valine-tRNA ligase [Candidatus Gottesmanbacteria bacterium GW2011_GWA1_42_26]KKS80837.1 MAG: Valine-tRNA ligase [Candidatus Gottesmanbacteria bacterium GW2011_GWC1_43_10]KKS85638.1 MAG: Valine-tRNA ligase [Candidatus Gottesmanbacteria bacterium GW2011_GWB1_43_11]OGG10646.1 MAG: valine--tRNA ligase [Candidatus Gottesmanbacteria bacterium RIFCSPHIGHO2_01_FULL_43_15]HCM37360.1 valine--tRNA ligase 
MDKTYAHQTTESRIYALWEKSGVFAPNADPQAPAYSIIMPPPNANGELHLGHATFVAISDALIRYHRMRGDATLWLPGVDHAGILAQVTFEKKLKKEQSKSRHDLGRTEFVKQCYQFCLDNKILMENQMRALGASCDWNREKFTMDPEISKLVLQTFVKMHQDGLIYRGYRIVNWCPRCRSTLSDLELEWTERQDPLYYINYGPFVLATVRPETKFGDTAIAVHPDDARYQKWIGKEIEVVGLLGTFKIKVIADSAVDKEFGTGVIKVTPGHDPLDWEIGQRHKLEVKTVIDFDGRLNDLTGPYKGLKVAPARKQIAADMQAKGLLKKVDENYRHTVATCERCGTVIEPLVSRQWFVKIKPLAQAAIKAVEDGTVKIIPEKYQAMYFNWMKNIRDWPISRQIWWGHQLPVWYARSEQKTPKQQQEFELLKQGDTRARTDILESPIVSLEKPTGADEYIQDPDTFDTWFSSGQWPVNTLKTSNINDFQRFYPTSVMNTAYEILFLWVARMIMFGLYLTGEVPFETALINGVLRDENGQKMSKSKGNGINPNEAIAKYGADAVRMALLAGRDSGNDLMISKQQMEERIRGYRNFSNKLWNIGRFILINLEKTNVKIPFYEDSTKNRQILVEDDKRILTELTLITNRVTDGLENYRFGEATSSLYEFTWHAFADWYLEAVKPRLSSENVQDQIQVLAILRHVYIQILKLLHPFMPFVTEEIWRQIPGVFEPLLATATWPKAII